MWLRRGEIPHFSAYERILLGNDTFLVNYTSVITSLANSTDRDQTALKLVEKGLKEQFGSRAFTMSMTEIWLAEVPESLDQSQAGIIEVLKTFDPEIKSFPIPEIW